ncbi:MAG: acylphosphatase [Deltaproteobacteria bacterium]|nr:acylphosphatase [Deltaproteobacteria bacterium]
MLGYFQVKKIRAHVLISGIVQGVFFRANTRDIALSHGIHGWVRNTMDGKVEAVFEGDETAVKKVVEWCKRGPSGARVDNIDIKWLAHTDEFNGFMVRR